MTSPWGNVLMRCESCHSLTWVKPWWRDERSDSWICDECKGVPKIYTLAEFIRGERE
jgi:hypothetical protein